MKLLSSLLLLQAAAAVLAVPIPCSLVARQTGQRKRIAAVPEKRDVDPPPEVEPDGMVKAPTSKRADSWDPAVVGDAVTAPDAVGGGGFDPNGMVKAPSKRADSWDPAVVGNGS